MMDRQLDQNATVDDGFNRVTNSRSADNDDRPSSVIYTCISCKKKKKKKKKNTDAKRIVPEG